MEIKRDFSLQKLNTFGIDIKAKHFVELKSIDETVLFVKSDLKKYDTYIILGGGSNLLFTGDFKGIVIKINIEGIHVVKEDKNYAWIKAGAGVNWHDLVKSCIKANFGGIENLSLIPGTVGAAPIQNIGAYGVALKDSFEALEAIDLASGEIKYFTNQECKFVYRESIFKHELRNKYIISNVVLRLTKNPVLNIKYGNVQEVLSKTSKAAYSIKDVSEAIIKIRQSKLPDPDKIGNAGSFFKNPIIKHELFDAIKISYPEIPSYKQANNSMKIPAAWLIDQCKMKGIKNGGAAVHVDQPLVLINQNNASGKDIVALSDIVKQKVKTQFGISLETEVRIV